MIQTKNYNRISISKKIDKKLAEPYSDCKETEDKTYRQENCIMDCINNKSLNEYNCSLSGFVGYNITLCSNYLFPKINKNFRNDCKKGCFKECEKTTYDYSISNGFNPNNKTSLSIYYSKLSYTEIVQIPKYTIFSLISSIGGALGVFIGIRFLSIIEFIEFFIELFSILVFKNFYVNPSKK